jgi:hypothetical protein
MIEGAACLPKAGYEVFQHIHLPFGNVFLCNDEINFYFTTVANIAGNFRSG